MRFNTKNKREKIREEVINYLTNYGWGEHTARYEVDNWIEGGLNSLTETPKEAIKNALADIAYNNKHACFCA